MARIPIVLVAMSMLAMAGACTECQAKCVGPSAEVVVGNDIAAVEVCDSDGVCTRQEFGSPGSPTFKRSFTLTTAGEKSAVTLDITAFASDEREITSNRVTARTSGGSCGCSGPARFFVSAAGVSALDG